MIKFNSIIRIIFLFIYLNMNCLEYKGIETGIENSTDSMISFSKGTNQLFLSKSVTLEDYPTSIYRSKKNVISLFGKKVINSKYFGRFISENGTECTYNRVGGRLKIDENLEWALFMYKTPDGIKRGLIIAPFKGHTTLREIEIVYDETEKKGNIRTKVRTCHRIDKKYENVIKVLEISDRDIFIENYFNTPEDFY